MTELLNGWIRGLTSACILTAVAQTLCPKGPVKRVTRLVCGVVLTAVLLSPLAALNMDVYSLSLASYRSTAARITGELEETEKMLSRLYIEEECAAYILDEAHALGLEGRVEVSAKWKDDCWVPWSAELRLGGEEGRITLSKYMEAELGIPAERQNWHVGG